MSLLDLFGNFVKSEEKTFEEEYSEYINSVAWKRKRETKISEVGGMCENCGKSKWSVRLTVHHLTYDHFKNEHMDELQVLCEKCHEKADLKRVGMVEEKRSNSAIITGFENWLDRNKEERGWRRKSDKYLEVRWRRFLRQISKRGKDYNIPYWRSPEWK